MNRACQELRQPRKQLQLRRDKGGLTTAEAREKVQPALTDNRRPDPHKILTENER